LKYYLLKRLKKDKTSYTFHVGYLKATGKGYLLMKSTGIKAPVEWFDENGMARGRNGKKAEAEADSIARKWLNDSTVSANGLSLESFLLGVWTPGSEYLRTKEKDSDRVYSVDFIKNSYRLLEDYFLPWAKDNGLINLTDLNHRNLLQWRNDLSDGLIDGKRRAKGRHNRQPLSAVSCNKVRQALFTALSWAVEIDLLDSHPGKKVKRISERRQVENSRQLKALRILELSEAKRLFNPDLWKSNYSDDFISYSAALFCFSTGARQGEARGLQFKNINFHTGFCHIVSSYQDGQGLKPPKWESIRMNVPLPDVVLDTFQKIKEFYPYHNPKEDDFVFPNLNDRNKPINKATLNKSLSRAIKRAEIDKQISFHDLRHTWASLAENSLPQSAIMSVLGHRNEQTTQNYTHATDQSREALKLFIEGLLT
jgi:integrase